MNLFRIIHALQIVPLGTFLTILCFRVDFLLRIFRALFADRYPALTILARVRPITLSLLLVFEIIIALGLGILLLDDISGRGRPKQGRTQIVLFVKMVEVELLHGAEQL